MVRIVADNDWVIYTLLGCGFIYALMFLLILRDYNLKDFLVQEYEDANNSFLVWVVVSVVYTVVFSVFVSQYIPIVPKEITAYQLNGFELNKMGYTLGVVSIFYLLKIGMSYLFYSAIGNIKKWRRFYFVSTRFYFVMSLILIVGCLVNFYYLIDKKNFLNYYFLFFAFALILKQFIYLFHNNQILPEKWYYKILYICTFQIAPVLALWKVLFF